MAASSAGQHNLSLGKLNPLEIPVPSLRVQDAGLRRLADLRADMSRLRSTISTSRSRTARLRAALLNAAFNGRLHGPTDSTVVKAMIGR